MRGHRAIRGLFCRAFAFLFPTTHHSHAVTCPILYLHRPPGWQVLWHKGINQIFAGCSDGVTRLLYSPRLSNKGALLCVGKAARKKDVSDFFE